MDAEMRSIILDFRDEVNNQFEKVDKRFDQIDKRFERNMIEQLIDLVGYTNKKVDQQSDRLDKMQEQLDALTIQKQDIELVFEKLTKNERDIAKVKAILLG